MSGPQNSEKVKLLISKLRKAVKTIVDIDVLLPILDEFYIFLTTESKQLPASKVKNYILKALFHFKLIYAIKANKFTDDNETKTKYKHKLCKIISFYIDVELFSVGIGKDSSDSITNRISTTIDSYFNEPENIMKIFRASLQIRKGKQIMKFKDIIIALFTKYFYRQARAQPLIIDDVLFLEQLSIYKIWSSLLDSQAHKDELLEMVVNYMVPLNKQILMSQLAITNADNFIEEALKTTSQQVIEKAIINNTDIIDLDPEINDSYVSSNINETLLNDLEHEQTIDKVCKPISWLDDLSMETTVKLIEKRVIIEIDDDEDDDAIEIVDLFDTAVIDDVVIDLNVVKNLSLNDKVVDPENNEIIEEACVNDDNIEDKVNNINRKGEKVQTNNENFLKSDFLRTYSRKEKSDIAYRSSIDTMEIGTMTDLIAHTKETEMCVENETSSTEPDMSQREIDNHLASSPLKIVKSFTCPPPSIPKLFDISSIRTPEPPVASKICIMERKTYIREEETPVYDAAKDSSKKVSNYVVKSRLNPKINKINLDDKTLQYEVSPCRNRINGVIEPVKPKKKSVRFADEVPTNTTIPLVTYGRIVDSLLYRSYVCLQRNTLCEKMIRKMMMKTSQQSQKSHKKSSKVPEIPAYKHQESINSKIQKSILKPKTTNNNDNQKHLDIYKVKKIDFKNTRYSKRCASFNGTMDSSKNQTSVESKSEVTRKIKHRRRSVYDSYKDENIAETVVPRVVAKENYSFKARHLRGSLSRDIEKPVVEEEPLIEEETLIEEKLNEINNVADTTSNDDVGTCNKIVYSMKLKDSKFLKMKTSHISSSDDKLSEDDEFNADRVEKEDQNETEELCHVLSSSTEEITIEEELSKLHKRPDELVTNSSENSAITVNKLSEECYNSASELSEEYHDSSDEQSEECNNSTVILVDKCEMSEDQKVEECDSQLMVECHTSTDLLVHESETQVDQQTEEIDNSEHHLEEEFDKTVDQESEECEKTVNQQTEDCDESAEKDNEEFEKPVEQVTEEYHQIEELNEPAEQLSDEHEKEVNHQTDEYNESGDQMTEECNQPAGRMEEEHTVPAEEITEECDESADEITEEYNEPVKQLEEEYSESTVQINEDNNESAGQVEEEYNESDGNLVEECSESAEHIIEEHIEPAVQLDDEYIESVELTTEDYNESVDQLTEVYEETVELITHESAITDQTDKENEETEKVTEKDEKSQESDLSSDRLRNDYEKLVDLKKDECGIIVKNLSKICNKPAYPLSANCYKSTEQNDSDEFTQSPGYSNVEHLEEEAVADCAKYNNMTKIREKAAAFSVIFNNNNISAFDIRTRANNNEKVMSNDDSDERNSFSPVQDQTDKANNEARARKRDLTHLIDSLYSNENENSKGEPIDLVTTGSSFDGNQNPPQNSQQTSLQTLIQTPLQTSVQTLIQTPLQTSVQTIIQTPVHTITQTTTQTTHPPLKKRRKTASPEESLVQNHYSMRSITNSVHSEVLAPKNRIIPLEESLPYVASAPFSAAFNILEKLNAEQFYLKNKQQQQDLINSQMTFKKAFYPDNVPNKIQEYPHVQNNNFTTGCDGIIVPKSTSNYPFYPYDNRTPAIIQAQTIIKAQANATVTRSSLTNYPVNGYNSSTELSNYAVPGPSREYNKRKSNTMTYPIYSRGPKKETQRLTAANTEHLKDLASTQSSNFSEKFVPYKRRQTARPRNSKTTSFIDDQPIVSQEMCYPISPITVMENNNARYLQQNQPMSYPVDPMIRLTNSSPVSQFHQEQPIIDDDISYPSNPMISIANTCTCQLQYYASCSLHPRNFENGVHKYKNPIQEGGVKAKNINDLLPIPNQRYGNNCRENLSTESNIDFNMDLSDVAANEEVFDYSNNEFGVDETPGGEFEEAYINYEPSRVTYRKPRTRQPPKQQPKPLVQPPTKTAKKSVTKSLTKSVTKLTPPYHFAMSPPNPPDSTSTIQHQSCINKKRGRPKGSKNRVKSDGLFLTLAESVNSSSGFF